MKKILYIYKNLSLPLKSSIWFMICTALQKCIAVITTPIFTRILSTEEYGIVSLYISWESLFTIFSTLYLTTGGGFFNGMKRYKNDRDGYTSSILCLVSIITIIMFSIYTIIHLIFGEFLNLSFLMVAMMFCDIFFTSAISLWSIRNRYEYKYKSVIFYTFCTSILIPILGIIMINLMPLHKAEAKILGIIIIKAIIYGYLYYKIISKGKKTYCKEYWHFSIKFNLPLLPHYLSQMILEQSDRVMISKICDISSAGIYSIAYNVSLIMKIFTTAINGTLTPWTYHCMEENKLKNINKVCVLIEILVGTGCVFICLLAPEIISLLASKEYHNAFWIIPPVSISVLFMMMYSFFVNIEFYFEKNKSITYASILSAIVNIILNSIFIRKYGFIAAGYTTLICYIIYAMFHYFLMKKICKENKIFKLYNGPQIWIFALIFVMLCIGCNLLYLYSFLRYCIIVFLFILILLIFTIMYKKNYIDLKKFLK